MSSARVMQMGIIPAIAHTASEETVRYALATLIAVSRNVLFSILWFRFVFRAAPQAGTPYLNIDDDTHARRRLLLLLGPSTFGMILAIAFAALAAFSQHSRRGY